MLNGFIKTVAMIFISLFVVMNVNADVGKGQKVIIKMLKKDCGFDGSVLAHKHTQLQWKGLYEKGVLQEELKTICPNSKALKNKYIPHVYDFLFNFALDSGNVPSC